MTQTLTTVPIGKVKLAPDNLRADLGDLGDLAASIKALGILEPLLTVQENSSYVLVAGNRRYAAAKLAGLKTVPVIVRDLSPEERTEIMLVENLQRSDLSPLEEARGYDRLIKDHAYSQRKLAERVGRSQAHVSKRLALLGLPEEVQADVDSGGIAVGDALALTKLDDPAKIRELVEEIKDDGKRGWRDWSAEEMVEHALAEKAREQVYQDTIAEAEKDPAPYLPMQKDTYGEKLPKGAVLLRDGKSTVGLKPSDHKKLACHAVTVVRPSYGDPKIQYLCTDPGSHKTGPTDEAKAERAAKIAHNKAVREAQARRREFCSTVVRKGAAAGPALEQLLGAWLALRPYSRLGKDGTIACELLGIEPEEPTATYDTDGAHRALAAFALKSQANVARVALAIALEVGEGELEGFGGWTSEVGKAHVAFLTGRGYKLTPVEREAKKEGRS